MSLPTDSRFQPYHNGDHNFSTPIIKDSDIFINQTDFISKSKLYKYGVQDFNNPRLNIYNHQVCKKVLNDLVEPS